MTCIHACEHAKIAEIICSIEFTNSFYLLGGCRDITPAAAAIALDGCLLFAAFTTTACALRLVGCAD
jgi:hypothetical protein